MRKKVINRLMTFIEKRKKINDIEREQIIYGLESIYMLVTKLIFIFIVALLLGIFKEMIIFLLLFNVIRAVAFGLHATKSWICLVSSTLLFIALPFIATKVIIPVIIKIISGIILTILILRNSPADTHKRPIVNKKRRIILKTLSTSIAVIYVIISLFTNNFISNCLLFNLLLEAILISPLTYRIFKLPYNNYLKYLEKEEQNVFS